MAKLTSGAVLVRRFNARLDRIIGTDLPILKRVKRFVIKSGGKRVRPISHYYFCQILGYDGKAWEQVGAIGELIHAASLLHDDVIDEASMRRGKPSVNAIEGNKAAILTGDYLLATAIDQLRSLPNSNELVGIFTRVLRQLSIGELLQMEHETNIKLDSDVYERVIQGKTGSLFGAMSESAALLASGPDASNRKRYREFGERMGRLFQIRDDYLDYFGEAATDGKPLYQDFKRGLVTRPIIVIRSALPRRSRTRLEKLWADDKKRGSAAGIEELEKWLAEHNIRKKLAVEIETEVHALMRFVRSHEPSAARERMIDQLHRLLVPVPEG